MDDPVYPMILAWAVPFFVGAVALEWWAVARGRARGRYATRDGIASMSMGVGNLVSDLLLAFIGFGALMWMWQYRLFDIGTSLGAVLVALVAQDFLYYWKHRIAHRVRWFWSAHVVHHSSEHYNLTTALRQPWNNHFTGYVLLSAPLVVLGIHPALLAFVGALNLLYQFWIHTEAINKLPRWFEAIFNTPSHHRVHHSTHPEHLDRNYAGIFIVWDRMFGTFVAEKPGEAMTYGLVKNIETYNPVRIAFAEMIALFRDAATPGLTLRQRLAYIFAPPGWSHDGSRQQSHEILADHRRATRPPPPAEGRSGT